MSKQAATSSCDGVSMRQARVRAGSYEETPTGRPPQDAAHFVHYWTKSGPRQEALA